MATSITLDEVQTAMQALVAAGVEPTVRRIRAQLGNRGSMDKILFLRRQALGEVAPEPASPPASLLQSAQHLVPDVWKHAVAEARVAVASELRQANEAAATARNESADIAALLAEQTARTEAEAAERARLAGIVAEQTAAMDSLRQEISRGNDAARHQADAMADLRAAVTGTASAWKELIEQQEVRFAAEREQLTQRVSEALDQSFKEATALAQARAEIDAAAREAGDLKNRLEAALRQAALSAEALGSVRSELAAQTAALEVERLRSTEAVAARTAAEQSLGIAQGKLGAIERRLDALVDSLRALQERHGEILAHQVADRDELLRAIAAHVAALTTDIGNQVAGVRAAVDGQAGAVSSLTAIITSRKDAP